MGNFRKSSSFIIGIFAVVTLLFYTGCTCPKSPDPLISFLEDGGFAVLPGQVPEADSVIIFSSDGNGAALDTANTSIGKATEYTYGIDVKRPIHLRFAYLDKAGKLLLEDLVSVEDAPGNPGTPIVAIDVVMGLSAPPPQIQPCPLTTEIASGLGEVVVTWVPNDWFEVRMTKANGSEEVVGVRMEASTISGSPGSAKIFRSNSHQCMTLPECDDSNIKVMKVLPNSETFFIVGSDNNNGASSRILRIKGPSGQLIKVKK